MAKWLVSLRLKGEGGRDVRGGQSFVVTADTRSEAVRAAFLASSSPSARRHRRGAVVDLRGATVELICVTPMGVAYSS